MKLVIGSDKSGFSLKESIKQHLLDHGYEVTDIGTRTVEHAMPFYEVAPIAAEMVQQKKAEYGVLVCFAHAVNFSVRSFVIPVHVREEVGSQVGMV